MVIPVFVGFDPREAVAYHVCCQSIIERASVPVAFYPLHLGMLKEYEETHTDGSNAFIYSRFLIPHLMGYSGHAIFMDGDMIVKGDIANLWALRDPFKAVQVVKHDYKTKYPVKYLGAKNPDYPRKNWSSVMIWNCGNYRNRVLTPDYVQKQTGSHLHRFEWLEDRWIGGLPSEWNHLVLEEEDKDAKLNHWTVGTPCFPEYSDCTRANEWWDEYRKAIAPC